MIDKCGSPYLLINMELLEAAEYDRRQRIERAYAIWLLLSCVGDLEVCLEIEEE